ncbi:MAG: hypothetical protein QXR19_16960 [Candidatus Jordarchaeaceae archaeon]
MNWVCSECLNRYKCYNKKTPLVLPYVGQKIMFMSEAPWNFENENVEQFIEVMLPNFLKEIEKEQNPIPRNIFDFLHQTFGLTQSKISEFLKEVYWTHIAKKSLKGIPFNKREKFARMCLDATNRELKVVKPRLLVIATSIGLRLLFNKIGFKMAFELQERELEKGKLLTSSELILKHSKCGDLTPFEEYKIAIFPNPSGRNRWKYWAYKNKKTIKNLLSHIATHF